MFLLLMFVYEGMKKSEIDFSKLDKEALARFRILIAMLIEQSEKDSARSEAEARLCQMLKEELEKVFEPEEKSVYDDLLNELGS